jgi:hypothetical protein
MLENMAGAVGFAMHEDRLARAAKNMRLAEAEQGRARRQTRVRRSVRVALAKTLLALAARLAPPVSAPETGSAA